ELRRALGDQAVPLPDEGPILVLARDDHLAAVAEGVRDRPGVGDGDRVAAVPVRDPEVELVPGAMTNRAGNDVAGQLIGLVRTRIDQLRRLLRLARGV